MERNERKKRKYGNTYSRIYWLEIKLFIKSINNANRYDIIIEKCGDNHG